MRRHTAAVCQGGRYLPNARLRLVSFEQAENRFGCFCGDDRTERVGGLYGYGYFDCYRALLRCAEHFSKEL